MTDLPVIKTGIAKHLDPGFEMHIPFQLHQDGREVIDLGAMLGVETIDRSDGAAH
ncbi:MAG: hypothetical protein ACR2GP_05830 [Burkholderiaceae bacterium]